MYKIITSNLKNEGHIEFEFSNIKREFKGFPDISKIETASVKLEYKFMKSTLKIEANVESNLIMLCSLSLKELSVPVDFNLSLVFSDSEDADYPLENVIDLEEIIIGNIIAEAPYNVYA